MIGGAPSSLPADPSPSRVRREQEAARRALDRAVARELALANRLFRDPGGLVLAEVDRAIDERLACEARLGEWTVRGPTASAS